MTHNQRCKLAVLGDHVIDRLILTIFLLKAGFTIIEASSADDVWRSVDEGVALSGVVIDISRVDGTGTTALKAIREREILSKPRRRLPVLVVAAHDVGGLRAECLAAGSDGFLVWPVAFSVMVNTVWNVIDLYK